jgi:hypothetical protein
MNQLDIKGNIDSQLVNKIHLNMHFLESLMGIHFQQDSPDIQ